jgi:hypothetical protein
MNEYDVLLYESGANCFIINIEIVTLQEGTIIFDGRMEDILDTWNVNICLSHEKDSKKFTVSLVYVQNDERLYKDFLGYKKGFCKTIMDDRDFLLTLPLLFKSYLDKMAAEEYSDYPTYYDERYEFLHNLIYG